MAGGRSKRSVTRTARKRCVKCGRVGWYRPRERRCKFDSPRWFGRGYWCHGRLEPAPITRKRVVPDDAAYVARQRTAAARALARAKAGEARARTRAKRLQTALRKWQAKVRRWERAAALPDAEVLAVRDRARHAGHVQKVRRRLLGGRAGTTSLAGQA